MWYEQRCPFQEIPRYALNDKTTVEKTFLGDRHFDQVKRVEKSPKAKQGYALNELMLGIMNWLCHEFSLCSMNCPKGHCGGKSIYFFVCPCSYHKLGDLSTSLEMTFLGDRHFDQTKCVEKSPKAKQGYALNELMLSIMN